MRRALFLAVIIGAWWYRRRSRRRRIMDLRGKVVLITGSSRGLGLGMAREFARRGARLVLCARNRENLERARDEMAASGAEVLAVPCDVGDRAQVERMVQQATDRFGRVDVVVNNAGIITMAPIQNQTLEDLHASMDVMFWGAVYPTLAVLPQMLERRDGRIVNITSIGGKLSAPHLLSYEAAKFAQVGFSQGLHAELARYGIDVVTVVPGFMRTASFLNASFKGRHRAEFTWFSVLGNVPVMSMSAEKAARQIVDATERGETEFILTLPAKVAVWVHGFAPGLVADAFGLAGRLMPQPDGVGRQAVIGKESETALSSSFLTALGRRVARRYHQRPEEEEAAVRPAASEPQGSREGS